ncbi:hypothetical protein D3C83_200220 [compost metagenome]
MPSIRSRRVASAMSRIAALSRSGAILIAIATLRLNCCCSFVLRIFILERSAERASALCKSRNPAVLGEETFSVT